MAGTVSETYVAALRHDMVDTGDATLVGVVRRPQRWFHGAVDENHPELGPPEELLEETKQRQEVLAMAGMCESGAHNAAWEETNFEDRYREHINSDGDAQAALTALRERLADGEDLTLVCFEADDKRCHRDILVELLS
jgi:uncharacterized protein YeaO (DUF488 family)